MLYEVAFKLKKNFKFYDNLLKNNGFNNVVNYCTHDIYWTNQEIDNLSEEAIKNCCIRFRVIDEISKEIGQFQNYHIYDDSQDKFLYEIKSIEAKEQEFIIKGFRRVFDTKKFDHQYSIKGTKSKIQLQEIDDIGLVLYYDNPDFYDLSCYEQKLKLIEELNSYGFEFNEYEKNLDKLRTLYYGHLVYEGDVL